MKTIYQYSLSFALIIVLNFSYSLNAQVDLSNGLLAHYPFEFSAADATGNGFDGTPLGSTSINDSICFGYNTNDRLSLPYFLLDGRTNFSFSFEIKFNGFNESPGEDFAFNHIISGANSDHHNKLFVMYEKNGIEENHFRFYMQGIGSAHFYNVNLNLDQWYCITICRDSDNNKVYLYVNGQPASIDGAELPGGALELTNEGLIIGQDQDEIGGEFVLEQCMNGCMDALRIYDRVINPEEAEHLAQICNINSLDSEYKNYRLSIFPNPTNDLINIAGLLQEAVPYSLYDSFGRLIEKGILQKNGTLNIKHLITGTYIIKITNERAISNLQFIKM